MFALKTKPTVAGVPYNLVLELGDLRTNDNTWQRVPPALPCQYLYSHDAQQFNQVLISLWLQHVHGFTAPVVDGDLELTLSQV